VVKKRQKTEKIWLDPLERNFVLVYWLSGFRGTYPDGGSTPLRREKMNGEFAV
jgi:hypothetical protein